MAALSLDAILDPILNASARKVAEKLPFVFRAAFLRLADELEKLSLDQTAAEIVTRIVDAWTQSDGSQPLVGFGLARLTEDEDRKLSAAGFSPIVILGLIQTALAIVEHLRPFFARGTAAEVAAATSDTQPALDVDQLCAAMCAAG